MSVISVHNANYLRTALKSHKQRVLSLYKRAVRDIESFERPDYDHFRYKAVLMRARFDENKNEVDMRKAKAMLIEGEEYLFRNGHSKPIKFSYSPGGICFERYIDSPDSVLDFWHPLEKAQYPYYFARREQRKKEYVEMWEAKHGKPPAVDLGITEFQNYVDEPATDEEKMYGPFRKSVKAPEDAH